VHAEVAGTSEEQRLLSQPEAIPQLVRDGKLPVERIPNPHWREDACHACHEGLPSERELRLRNQEIVALCDTCHDAIGNHANIHPIGMTPSKKFRRNMAPQFYGALKRGGGTVTCISCHDVVMQCKTKRFAWRRVNPSFLLEGPYRSRTGICYNCHDRLAYQRLNPHDQITEQGTLVKEKCLICHVGVPEELEHGRVISGELHENSDRTALCLNCHVWIPHPGGDLPFLDRGGPNHLVVPPVAILDRMNLMQAKNGLILPREPGTGRIYCGTCHNVHERGVIKNSRDSKGADQRFRLRAKSICVNCHKR